MSLVEYLILLVFVFFSFCVMQEVGMWEGV